jgi:predicted DNA-binding protein
MRKIKQYNVPLEDEEVERIDSIANELGKSRAQMLRSFVLGGLTDMELIRKTGIFSAVLFSDKVMKKFK